MASSLPVPSRPVSSPAPGEVPIQNRGTLHPPQRRDDLVGQEEHPLAELDAGQLLLSGDAHDFKTALHPKEQRTPLRVEYRGEVGPVCDGGASRSNLTSIGVQG